VNPLSHLNHPGEYLREFPLLPYLFVAYMERLSQLIEANYNAGNWKAIPVSKGDPRISHLMFADDVLLFGEASKDQTKIIQALQASGHKLSAPKSSVYFSANKMNQL